MVEVGYTSGTTVDVIASGQGARMFADIQKWTVNLFQSISMPLNQMMV